MAAVDINGRTVKAGRIGDIQRVKNQEGTGKAAKEYSHIRVQLEDGTEMSLLLTDSELKRCVERAKKNPEDLPRVSWLRDLLD